jgi:hypothetical protein
MKKLALTAPLAFALAALVSLALPRRADAAVDIHISLPVAPPLVVVQPGVQVVEDFDDEVFFTSGWYWVRRDGGWYRARRPNAAFVWVEQRRVPAALVRSPPGHYVRYKKAKHHGGHGHGHDHDHGHGNGHGKHKHKGRH